MRVTEKTREGADISVWDCGRGKASVGSAARGEGGTSEEQGGDGPA